MFVLSATIPPIIHEFSEKPYLRTTFAIQPDKLSIVAGVVFFLGAIAQSLYSVHGLGIAPFLLLFVAAILKLILV